MLIQVRLNYLTEVSFNKTVLGEVFVNIISSCFCYWQEDNVFDLPVINSNDCSYSLSIPLVDTIINNNKDNNDLLSIIGTAQRLTESTYLIFSSLSGVVLVSRAVFDVWNFFRDGGTKHDAVLKWGHNVGTVIDFLYQKQLLYPKSQQHPDVSFGLGQTLTAWIHVTNACNLRCHYCYVTKTADQMSDDTGKKAIDAIIRSAITHHYENIHLKYAGGEATLNSNLLLQLHQYAEELGEKHNINVTGVVLSNGVFLPDKLLQALKKSNLSLMISLDGIGNTHDLQRPFISGRGSFAHIERTLERLSHEQIVPQLSITLSQANLMGLAETVRFALDHELPFSLNFYRENDCSVDYDHLAYQDAKMIASIEEAFAVIEENLPAYSLLGALLDRVHLGTVHDRPCGVGQDYMVIDYNGNISKCQMDMAHQVTNVNASDPLQLIRADQIHLQNPAVTEKEGCQNCDWRYWCAGGCPQLTYRITGRYDVKSPNCNIYKALFPAVLRLEGLRLLKYGIATEIDMVATGSSPNVTAVEKSSKLAQNELPIFV